MKTISVLLCFSFTFAFVSGAVKYRKCGSAVIKKVFVEGTENVATPVIYRKKSYTIKVDYVAGESSNGFNDLQTTWYAIMNGIPVPWDMPMAPGCAATNPGCPIKAGGEYVYTETFSVPSDAPAMRAVVKLVQKSGNSEHLCLIFSLNIK